MSESGSTNSPEIAPESTQTLPLAGDALEAAWEEVDRRWDDEKAHARFVELGRLSGRLAEVGRRYREQQAEPERAEIATRQIGRIVAVAMAALEATAPTDRARGKRTITAVGYIVAIVLIAVVARLLLAKP